MKLTSLYCIIIAAVNCGSPPVPINGSVSITSLQTTFQSIAIYSCDLGFMLVGENRRICEAQGAWSGQTPTCTGMITFE